ncbi:MAG: MraY family glycosyltransferase [Planctomycetota bacterium]
MNQIIPVITASIAAIAVVLFAGPLFSRAAWRIGLIDRPKLRGVHCETVPRAGGIMIAAAFTVALLVQLATAKSLGVSNYLQDIDYMYLLLVGLIILGVGMLDDIRALGAPTKLMVQSAAAIAAWFVGFQINHVDIFGVITLEMGYLSPVVTVIFIVAITNAFNMIDGIDGLCSGVAFIALLGLGLYSVNGGEYQASFVIPLAMATLAFLRWNFGKSRSFLGDSGSMMLGFIVGTVSLKAMALPDPETGVAVLKVVPLFLLLSLPIIDITAVFFRRIAQGRSPMRADRGHIHHIALQIFDWNTHRTTLTLLFMCSIGAAGAVLVETHPMWRGVAVALPVGLFMMIYLGGGYLSWRNLRNSGPATEVANRLAHFCKEYGAIRTLDHEDMLQLVRLCRIQALALFDEDENRVWSIGVPDLTRKTLEVPLYSAGRVKMGRLLIQGPVRTASQLAFPAHLLLPIYGTFMEYIEAAHDLDNTAIEEVYIDETRFLEQR